MGRDGIPLSDLPLQVLVEGNFSLPRQWRRAAFAGQMMLGAELLLPHGKGHLVALISFSFLRMAGTLQPSLRRERCVLSLQQHHQPLRRRLGPNRHHSIFAAGAPVPRPFDLCQRPKSIADRARAGANPFSRASLAFVRNSDGWEERGTGRGVYNK